MSQFAGEITEVDRISFEVVHSVYQKFLIASHCEHSIKYKLSRTLH